MRLVDRPAIYPSVCAVLPYVGASRTSRWIDTGSEMPSHPNRDSHVYVSDLAVMEMARLMGYVPAAHVRSAELQSRALEEKVAKLQAALAQAESHLDAIDLLESANYTARKKPGRPRKEVEA